MSEPAYSIGIDFGTESGRAALIDLNTGDLLATSVLRYPRAVIDRTLPGTDERLPSDWALQDPDDWVKVVNEAVPEVVAKAGVAPGGVIGLGIDFTSCTVLPVTAAGVPLCTIERWRDRKHAWPKLWKHHAAQPVADRLNEVALERGVVADMRKVVVLLTALPVHLLVASQQETFPLPMNESVFIFLGSPLGVATGAVLTVVVGIVAVFCPLWMGLRAFRKLEF